MWLFLAVLNDHVSSLTCGRMYTHEEALTAKKALNGSAFNGRSIFIKW